MDSTTLYRYFDAEDTLLYVGISLNAVARLKQHYSNKAGWISDISRSTFEHFTSRKEAADAEKQAIQLEKPLWNVQHNKPLETKADKPVAVARYGEVLVYEPAERCCGVGGEFLSTVSGEKAKQKSYSCILPAGASLAYKAIAEWMEHFGYIYENGYITGKSPEFCASYSAAISYVTENWKEDFHVKER